MGRLWPRRLWHLKNAGVVLWSEPLTQAGPFHGFMSLTPIFDPTNCMVQQKLSFIRPGNSLPIFCLPVMGEPLYPHFPVFFDDKSTTCCGLLLLLPIPKVWQVHSGTHLCIVSCNVWLFEWMSPSRQLWSSLTIDPDLSHRKVQQYFCPQNFFLSFFLSLSILH